jgi:hypothetical protein
MTLAFSNRNDGYPHLVAKNEKKNLLCRLPVFETAITELELLNTVEQCENPKA